MHEIPLIDYRKVADAQKYYESCGYQEIAVPWLLSYEAYCATRPPDRKEFYSLHGYLNASGEQGFIELLMSGKNLTKQCCITSCFRDEPELDGLHHLYFVKVELINTDVSKENLKIMITEAKRFIDHYILNPTTIISTSETGDSFDIIDTITGIELGSYGIRSYKNYQWIYGTGIALPRIDTVIHLNNH
jgi:hypothetical protein